MSRTYDSTARSDPRSLERGVRQLLAEKVCGAYLGLWLLVPEHLRLGTWQLLLDWTGQEGVRVEPRLALQRIHEATLCVAGLRAVPSLPQASFGLLQGLPFLASDQAIHPLLAAHTVEQAQQLQCALGQRRRALGDYVGKVLIIDPHRFRSPSKRRMRKHRKEPSVKATKVVQTFFAFDGDTKQPVCFPIGTPSRTVTPATPELLERAATILGPQPVPTLALADAEHFSLELIHCPGRLGSGPAQSPQDRRSPRYRPSFPGQPVSGPRAPGPALAGSPVPPGRTLAFGDAEWG